LHFVIWLVVVLVDRTMVEMMDMIHHSMESSLANRIAAHMVAKTMLQR
jgi:hypothetical protein